MSVCILDDGLEKHAGNESFERGIVNLLHDIQAVFSEARDFDVQVVVNELQLLAQRDKRFMFAKETSQNVAELQHYAAGRIWIEADQGGHRVQGIEEEVRMDAPDAAARPQAPSPSVSAVARFRRLIRMP